MDSAITLLVLSSTCVGVAIGGTFLYHSKTRRDNGISRHQDETSVLPNQSESHIKQTSDKTLIENRNTLGKNKKPSAIRKKTGDGGEDDSDSGSDDDSDNGGEENQNATPAAPAAPPSVDIHPPKLTPEAIDNLPNGLKNNITQYTNETVPRSNTETLDKLMVRGIINMYMVLAVGGYTPRTIISQGTRTQLAVALVWRTWHDNNKDISLTRSKCITLLQSFDTSYITDSTLLATAKSTLANLEKVVDGILSGKVYN